jgi:hypothetical protein
MYDESLISINEDDAQSIEGLKHQGIDISKLRHQQYLASVDKYSGLLTNEAAPIDETELVDEPTRIKLVSIPANEADRIIAFSQDLMTKISEDDLKINQPINPRHLQAYFAAVYKKEKSDGKSVDDELYIRLIAALDLEEKHIGNRFNEVKSSINAVNKYTTPDSAGNYFYKNWSLRGAVGNVAINVISSTMPVSERPTYDDKPSEKIEASAEQYNKVQRKS